MKDSETLDEAISRTKMEIVADVLAGKVPAGCAAFATLHEYDAGSYRGVRAFMKDTEDAVDIWLKEGHLMNSCPPAGWRICDGNDAFNPWGSKSYLSLFEKRVGGNGFPTCDLTVLVDGDQFLGAHGSKLMPERVSTVMAAAELTMRWAVENGWSAQALEQWNELQGENAARPVPVFEPMLDYVTAASNRRHDNAIKQARNMVDYGYWNGKIVDIEDGVAMQKINRAGETVQHDVNKLSMNINVGDVITIEYKSGLGLVSGNARGTENER